MGRAIHTIPRSQESAMRRAARRFCLLLVAPATPACSTPVGRRGGPGYDLTTDRDGNAAITPRNDARYQYSEPMDLRTR
jgi:hypothetical protein